MYKEKKVRNIAFSLGLFAVYLVLLYFFTKYGVYRELNRADEAERIFAEKQQELQEIQEKNNEFMDVRTEYSRYGNSYMTEQEAAAQDMVTMLNIIDERIYQKGAIQSVNVSGNVAEIKLGISDANRLPEIIRSLEQSEYISYVTAQTASTVEQNYNRIAVDEEGNVIAPQYVDASITLYFR
jgi:Tfp pilus assembly protein PilN